MYITTRHVASTFWDRLHRLYLKSCTTYRGLPEYSLLLPPHALPVAPVAADNREGEEKDEDEEPNNDGNNDGE